MSTLGLGSKIVSVKFLIARSRAHLKIPGEPDDLRECMFEVGQACSMLISCTSSNACSVCEHLDDVSLIRSDNVTLHRSSSTREESVMEPGWMAQMHSKIDLSSVDGPYLRSKTECIE